MFQSCSTKSYNKRFIYFTFITLAVLERISEGPGTIIRRLEGRRELLDDPIKCQILLNSPNKIPAKVRKGGRQPKDNSQGNRRFPNKDPVLPIIISRETTIDLKECS